MTTYYLKTMIYKAISIRQPWADFFIHAGKDIENRMSESPVALQLAALLIKTRQPQWILLHTGQQLDRDAMAWVEQRCLLPDNYYPKIGQLLRGGIVGAIRVRGIAFKRKDLPYSQFRTIGWVPVQSSIERGQEINSPWAMPEKADTFICIDQRMELGFTACRGYQNLFTVDEAQVGDVGFSPNNPLVKRPYM